MCINNYDGYTDALILSNIIISPDRSKRSGVADLVGFALSNNVSESAVTVYDAIGGLKALIDHGDEYAPYSNYFVASTFFYRFLLAFFTLDTVKYLQQLLTVYGIVFVSTIIYRFQGTFRGVVPFMTMVITGNLITMSGCLTYAVDIIIMILAMILALYYENAETNHDWILFFGVVGMLSFSMNYWSFPLLTLTGPLISLYMVRNTKCNDVIQIVIKSIKCVFAWIVGFGIEILFRIVTGNLICDNNTTLEHIKYYTTKDSVFDNGLSRFQRLGVCWNDFFNVSIKAVVVSLSILILCFINCLLKTKNKNNC